MSQTKSVQNQPRRRDSGEALIEIALVLPILLLISMGMLDFGRAFHAKNIVDAAAREACRVAVVTSDLAVAQQRGTDILTAGGLVGVVDISPVAPNKMVTTTVTTRFTFITPGLFAVFGKGLNDPGGINMIGVSVMRQEGV
ncbi:MAG TPA: TadE family protein [Candidatus Polarisedimenticolia bacterium]|nr:TadE family protein [Candidatus Polarisedimenticolia bacterium]